MYDMTWRLDQAKRAKVSMLSGGSR